MESVNTAKEKALEEENRTRKRKRTELTAKEKRRGILLDKDLSKGMLILFSVCAISYLTLKVILFNVYLLVFTSTTK